MQKPTTEADRYFPATKAKQSPTSLVDGVLARAPHLKSRDIPQLPIKQEHHHNGKKQEKSSTLILEDTDPRQIFTKSSGNLHKMPIGLTLAKHV